MGYVLAVITAWALVGLFIALVYRRAGHSTVVFATLGLVLGPLTILLFGDLRDDDDTPAIIVRASPVGQQAGSGLRVLLAVDENEASTLSAVAAVRMLGPSVTQLTIASVIDYETARAPRTPNEPLPRLSLIHI